MIVVTAMDVYLVPIGGERYELYCEVPDEPEELAAEPAQGFFQRLRHRFNAMLAEAEHHRQYGHPEPERLGWFGRVKARSMRWVAESIAEALERAREQATPRDLILVTGSLSVVAEARAAMGLAD